MLLGLDPLGYCTQFARMGISLAAELTKRLGNAVISPLHADHAAMLLKSSKLIVLHVPCTALPCRL